jgi:hypothetical protein
MNGTTMVGKMAIGQVVRAGGSRASPVALATRKANPITRHSRAASSSRRSRRSR